MNDKQLLELAAKAAGYSISPMGRTDGNFIVVENEDGLLVWNPLTSGADAFRLMVKLQLTVCNEHVSAGAVYCTRGDEEFPTIMSGKNESEVIPEDYLATCRAIVAAAAQIGQSMSDGEK